MTYYKTIEKYHTKNKQHKDFKILNVEKRKIKNCIHPTTITMKRKYTDTWKGMKGNTQK